MEKVHKTIVVSGMVQGVGFRFSTRVMARAMGIKGNVRNLMDGRVQIEAEASPKQMEVFLNWCKKGPVNARIHSIEITDNPVQNYSFFDIAF